MGFERNDVVFKNRLREALNEENDMGFEHNDIVTVDVMNAAIAGGGGGNYKAVNASVTGQGGSFSLEAIIDDSGNYPAVFEKTGGWNYAVNTDSGETTVCKVVFSGDSCVVYPQNTVTSLSGDAVYDSGAGTLTVTGDFEISGFYDD